MQINNTFGFYDVINKYLKTTLNSHENCITVKFKGEDHKTSAYHIGVKSLAEHKDSNKFFKKQIFLLNAFVETLQNGSPTYSASCSDRFLYKIIALYKTAVESIFWISFGEKALLVSKVQPVSNEKKESEYRKILTNALKEYINFFKKNDCEVPSLNLSLISNNQSSNSDHAVVRISSRKISKESQKSDIKSSEFFESPFHNPEKISKLKQSHSDQKIKKSEFVACADKDIIPISVEKNSSERRSSSLSKLHENKVILDDDIKYKKNYAQMNIAGLSQLELEFCKYVAFKKLKFPTMSLKKIEKTIEYQEFKNHIEREGKHRFNAITSMGLCEPSMIKMFLEEEIRRMLKKVSCSSESFAADIDRHILNLIVVSYDETTNLSIVSPQIPSANLCSFKVKKEAFHKILSLLVNKLIEEFEFIKKISFGIPDSAVCYKAILEKWNDLVKAVPKRDIEEPFVSLCKNFIDYLTVQDVNESFCEKEIESYRIRNKVLRLLWLMNQEMYSMPLFSILKALPEGAMAPKPGLIQLHFFQDGRIEAVARASMVPSENSHLGDFGIIAFNLISSTIRQIPDYTSQVSIDIINADEAPNFIKNTLSSMGFSFG
ncbi:MAG: hypothetical protein H0W50_01260 [Parachlamydiaceae bacterium]|nr:hypothetical protein [Parachlamydiaceae bacterium]